LPELSKQDLLTFLTEILRLAAWLGLLAVVFLPFERIFAVRPRKVFSKTLAQDVGYYFINGLFPALLMALPLSLAAYAAHTVVPWRVQTAIAAWPLWQRVASALLVSEIGFYWGHRWAHQIPFIWRFHSIHHSAREIYFLISSRAHPIDNVFVKLCGFLPVYAIGIATPLTRDGGTVSALLVLALTAWGFFIHSNLRWRLGPLEWVVATPHFHHWHHTLGGERDRNYASMLPIMDWIFGTLHLPRKRWPEAYGIEAKLPESMAGQLLYPLRPPQVGLAKEAVANSR